MIGGGDYVAFPPTEENKKFIVQTVDTAQTLDPELFVRSAQCSALFPMMQFSAAPWRLLDEAHLRCCLEAAQLHIKFAAYILEPAHHTAKTGEPTMRHMAYAYPELGYETIRDQFMLGDELLVAPVLEKGAVKRTIVFPPGRWQGDDGSVVKGSVTLEVAAPLSRLPWYRKSH